MHKNYQDDRNEGERTQHCALAELPRCDTSNHFRMEEKSRWPETHRYTKWCDQWTTEAIDKWCRENLVVMKRRCQVLYRVYGRSVLKKSEGNDE